MKNKMEIKPEHLARASCQNIPISTKHSVEISRNLRYKTTVQAKQILEPVIALKKALPYYHFIHDIGHRAGMSTGRYPQKAAKEFLHLLKAVEANAQAKGLNTSNLKIIKIIANKASIPQTGNRWHRGTKRTHLEIEVREMTDKNKEKKSETKEHKEKGNKEHLKAPKTASKQKDNNSRDKP
ncbi:MAG: 50S ribosomal protein L22 [Nanoarchaeota archaeon]